MGTCKYCEEQGEKVEIKGIFAQLNHVLEKHQDKLSGKEKALNIFKKSKGDSSPNVQ